MRCFRRSWRTLFSHAFTGEIDAIGVVNEAVQDGIGQSWVCNDLIPVIQGQLTGDDCRSAFVAVFNDLKHITSLVIIEFFRSPVIENEKVGFGELLEDPAITSVASREGSVANSRGTR